MQAAAWLVNTSPLYQDQGITIDENWLREVQNSLDEANISSAISNDTDSQAIKKSVEDEWSEDETEIPAGVTDTMLTPPDYVHNTERQQIYNIAPGEGNTPLSVFSNQYSEEMAYPGIFLGQKRPHDKQRLKSVYYSEICKSELRRSHRRAATCVENIFFKAKKLQMKFLCSFSSAETKWNHLLRILGNLMDHKNYSEEELNNLTWDDRCCLIQSDPVTCARHFDFQFNTFLKDVLTSELAPVGKVKDWFYRVKYQQRGSPHIHMLIWLEGAPVFGVDKDEDVVAYIDSIITCRKPDNNTELLELVCRQTHRHSHTRRKQRGKICRFNYPQPPMRSTKILYRLEENTSPILVRSSKELWKKIKNTLNDLKEGKGISFDELLKEFYVSERQYILAIQSSLNCPTIFLKRSPNELRINNYNLACLLAWRANMDIQYVLDVYACAMYIVSYISKAQKEMSELLRRAVAEANEGNTNIKQVRDIGNKFLNSVEISAQEAVYVVLQLPMRKASRSVIFIYTSPPAERVELLKPLSEIENMEDDSEEIQSGGLLKRYVERPECMQNVTLADWTAWYDSCGQKCL